MTSKEALDKLNYECIRCNGADDEYRKELNIIKKGGCITEGTEKVPFGIKDLKNFFKTIF